MKNISTLICILIVHFYSLNAGYNDLFSGERLRFDYAVAGDNKSMIIYGYSFIREPLWGGSTQHLIDTFRYGEMMLEVYDSISGVLIYSHGYSSLFNEWQTVEEAKTMQRVFLESVIMPFPRNTVIIKLYERDSGLNFREAFSTGLNPTDINIAFRGQPTSSFVKLIDSTGMASVRTDIVFIAEGYTSDQHDKFLNDASRYKNILYSWAPYSGHRLAFNLYAVFIPSEEAGTDNPPLKNWVSTVLESSMNTFGSERYLTVLDIPRLRNCVSGIPYDQICVLINSNNYGGGGIYNLFTAFTSDNQYSEFLFHHEFGHAFASLADEYFTSTIPYGEVYRLDVEPYEPNITTRIAFNEKWENMISDSIPLPTPDSVIDRSVVGLFEGGGYNAKGIYRPACDCSMKSKINDSFCPVCQKAIINMILSNGN